MGNTNSEAQDWMWFGDKNSSFKGNGINCKSKEGDKSTAPELSLLSSSFHKHSTPFLPTVLSAGRRPTQVCGNDTARAAEIFLHFSPSRSQTGWHWLESGAARQGQSMRIDRAARLRLQSWKISRQLKREGERDRGRERGGKLNCSSSQQTSLQINALWPS